MQLWLGVSNVLIQQWHNPSEKLPIPPLHKWSSREDDTNDKGWTPKIGRLIGNQTSKVPIKLPNDTTCYHRKNTSRTDVWKEPSNLF